MRAPIELPPIKAIIDLHAEALEEHGGAPGLRDKGALEAALARPRQILAYSEESVTVFDLAAALCVGICRNHPFVDGNKRAGFLALLYRPRFLGHQVEAYASMPAVGSCSVLIVEGAKPVPLGRSLRNGGARPGATLQGPVADVRRAAWTPTQSAERWSSAANAATRPSPMAVAVRPVTGELAAGADHVHE